MSVLRWENYIISGSHVTEHPIGAIYIGVTHTGERHTGVKPTGGKPTVVKPTEVIFNVGQCTGV